MEFLDDAQAVIEDAIFAFDDVVRRQPALAFAETHAAAGGVKAYAQLACCSDFIAELPPVGKKVKMIRDRGGSGQHQLGERELCAHVNGFGVEPAPDRIQEL